MKYQKEIFEVIEGYFFFVVILLVHVSMFFFFFRFYVKIVNSMELQIPTCFHINRLLTFPAIQIFDLIFLHFKAISFERVHITSSFC